MDKGIQIIIHKNCYMVEGVIHNSDLKTGFANFLFFLSFCLSVCLSFFFFPLLFRAVPVAYGSSQARGQITAAATP